VGEDQSLGIAPTWLSKDSDLDNLEYTGAAIWSSLAIRLPLSSSSRFFTNDAQAVFHARYHTNEQVPLQSGQNQFAEQNTLILSAKLRLSGADTMLNGKVTGLNFSVDGAYFNADKKMRRMTRITN
jgi:hypothetical protein